MQPLWHSPALSIAILPTAIVDKSIAFAGSGCRLWNRLLWEAHHHSSCCLRSRIHRPIPRQLLCRQWSVVEKFDCDYVVHHATLRTCFCNCWHCISPRRALAGPTNGVCGQGTVRRDVGFCVEPGPVSHHTRQSSGRGPWPNWILKPSNIYGKAPTLHLR